jgi:hypothetical protein
MRLLQLFFKAAQVYRADAQVGGDHVLGHPVMNVGKNLADVFVPLCGRKQVLVF